MPARRRQYTDLAFAVAGQAQGNLTQVVALVLVDQFQVVSGVVGDHLSFDTVVETVIPSDDSGQGQNPLGDSGTDPSDRAPAVAFDVELAREFLVTYSIIWRRGFNSR